jgi:ABC-2 type transport system ATP-binding protein
VIEAEGVRKLYGGKVALDDVSFRIERGEVVGFLGLNGAGKTTMLRILCGLLLPSGGRVRVDGVDAVEQPLALRRSIGFLPDRPPLYGDMTVRDMLRYAGRLHGVAARDLDGRVNEVIALTGLSAVAGDLVETLSHGFRQRAGIATAIVHAPRLVVLDEPISGLDPAQIVEMRAVIRGLKDRHTVLMSSHILGEVSETCDRILVLHGGRIVAQGREADLARGAAIRIEVIARGALAALRDPALLVGDGVSDLDAATVDGGLVRLRARCATDTAREGLVRALVQAGFGVRSVVPLESDLESLFLTLTAGTPGARNGPSPGASADPASMTPGASA